MMAGFGDFVGLLQPKCLYDPTLVLLTVIDMLSSEDVPSTKSFHTF